MSSYLLEAYTPASALVDEIEARVRIAAAEHSEAGTAVRHARSIFVPEDETCFHVLAGTLKRGGRRDGQESGELDASHHEGDPLMAARRRYTMRSPKAGELDRMAGESRR